MTLRVWFKQFFLATLIIGAVSTILTSFFVQQEAYEPFLNPFNAWEIFGAILWYIVLGFVYSIISQMGFFAYLVIHQFGLGFFRSFWNYVLGFLVAVTLFDLVYLRYTRADNPESIFPYITVALVLLIFGLVVSYVKAKETNRKAFIPALFVMVVMTTIEWVPTLRVDDQASMMLMVVPLLACNTYQLLKLHRIVGVKGEQSSEVTTAK
ncbi:KinB-signaling pathway activation protein [Bacillaceae bacterium W0354]